MRVFRAACGTALFGLAVAGSLPLAGQEPSAPGEGSNAPYLIPRIPHPLVLDGSRHKPEWEALDPLPAVMMIPHFGGRPTERTEFRVLHDGEFLYVSCRAYDSDPASIQTASLRRDELGWNSDRCMIYLDTLNDEENSLGFITTPAGAQTDVAHSGDGMHWNADWNTFWDVAVVTDEEGWHAEFRIPFSSLLLQVDGDGRISMGMSLLRSIPRKNERAVYPAIPPRWGNFSHTRSSQMQKVVVEGVVPVRPLYLTPFTLAGGGYSHSRGDSGSGYVRGTQRVGEVGGDLKFGLTPNLTLDLTINPDFAQVEADDQQVNLTRFSLFFPEKRRFFQDRASNFEFQVGDEHERLFHSRQVGLAEGRPVRIYGGGRLVGRMGEWDVGGLMMQTAGSDLLGSQNQSVLRLRRRVRNANSYLGGIATARVGDEGERNLVYGLDGIFRIRRNQDLTVMWAETFGASPEGSDPRAGRLARSLMRVQWDRPGEDGLVYGVGLTRVGGEFDPGMGFLRRRDYMRVDAALGHGWRHGQASRLRSHALGIGGVAFRRQADGSVESAEVEPRATLTTRSAHQWTLSAPLRHEDLPGDFRLSANTIVPQGSYQFGGVRVTYAPPQGSLFRAGLTLEEGRFFDGRRRSFSIRPGMNPSRHLTLAGAYVLDQVEFGARGESFTAHVARIRTEVMFSASRSASLFVQYNSTLDAVVANLRLHLRPREGNDLYLVWNEGLLTSASALELQRPTRQERILLLKYSHTFRLGR